MNFILFFALLVIGYALFVAGAISRIVYLFPITAVIFLALAFASFDIEYPVFFFNQTSGEVISYVYHDYSTANAYLCVGMGIFSIVVSFLMSFELVRGDRR